MKPALIIFIKNPEKGKVKTRLAATVGDDEALRIYGELLKHTRQITEEIYGLDRYVFYSSFVDETDDWKVPHFYKKMQSSGGLGDKMSRAFQEVFESKSPVLIVGSDCASLTSEIILKAYEILKEKDFVIGPAVDGGYYLLGMKTFEPSVFEHIQWSTDQVFPQTKLNIKKLKKTVGLLPELSDIDREKDWKRWGW